VAKSSPAKSAAARAAAAKAAGGKSSSAGKSPARVASGRPAGLFTWIAVGLVIVVVLVLVILKVTSGSNSPGTSGFQATDATTMKEITGVPASVFDAVGVTSPVAPVSPPIPLKNQPAITGTSSTGATVPKVFYLGAEYCPYCAAERWSAIVALSRFGTWSNLGDTESSTLSGEPYPGTPTFTFLKASYSSKYLSFTGIEQYTNVFDSATNFYTPLMTVPKALEANFRKYDTTKYIPGITSSQNGSIPYMTIDNKYLVSGASFTPAALSNLTRSQIAAGLSDPTNPVTRAIVTDANYLSAAICTATKNQPASVCASPGVMAAKKAMGIK
jgi:Domain of unknown function (DUF929)